MRWRKPPPGPENVRFVYDSGRTVPCELQYRGVEDGSDVWEVVNAAIDPSEGHWVIKCDVLPARTMLRFPIAGT